ncbi:hypothetical protein, partial [Methyloglobulus sp.]|uniref:hypothetical protein n=1 Tax=Methyloglobulus sp. TaxID=2518622 RepID=UPI003989FEBD
FGVSVIWFSTIPFLVSFAQLNSQRAPFVIWQSTEFVVGKKQVAPCAAPSPKVKRIAAANVIARVWVILLIVICPELS